ncbi:MAG: hypothetical protein GX496_05115 [Firmicutes bacterium]|nr:hypothetical protein [Bacillota bacterium]
MDDIENEDGLRCVGAPVYSHSGQAVAVISCSGPVFSAKPAETEALGRLVLEASRAISRAMGHAGEEGVARPDDSPSEWEAWT